MAGWNLARFAETLLPLLHENQEEAVKIAQDAISGYMDLYQKNWLAGMREKLGIFSEEEQDATLVEELLSIMQQYHADYTNTFRGLTIDKMKDMPLNGTPEFTQWHEKWHARLGRQEESRETSLELMRKSNPAVIPRNHRVEEALEAAVNEGDLSVMEKLLNVLSSPYVYSTEQEEFCTLPAPSNLPYRTFCGT